MRIVSITGTCVLIVGSILWQDGAAWAGDAKWHQALLQAAGSNDFQGVLRELSSIRSLDRQDPIEFLRLTKVAAPVLRTAALHPDAKRDLYDLLPQVLETSCPSNILDAAAYFELKKDVLLDYFNLDAVRTNTAWLIGVGHFVGEARSRLIPNYRNQGTSQPGLQILLQAGVKDALALTNSVLREAYEQAVARNDQEMQMNRLQSVLREVNVVMTFHVIQAATPIARAGTHASKFVDELVSNGRLTGDERMKLQRGSVDKNNH